MPKPGVEVEMFIVSSKTRVKHGNDFFVCMIFFGGDDGLEGRIQKTT